MSPELKEGENPCDDGCHIKLDVDQMEIIYDKFNEKVRNDLQDDYDCKKINGATYADTWAKMMAQVVTGSLQAMVSIATKETAMDRVVKQEQVDSSQASTTRNDDLATSKIAVDTQDILNKIATASLTSRQESGFDDNVRQKLYEAQINSWALMFSSGLIEDFPTHLNNGKVGQLAIDIENAIGGTGDTIGYFTEELTATSGTSGGTSTISWGSVAGASIYTLYASSTSGGVVGYPKTVSANGNDSFNIPTVEDNGFETFSFKVTAVNATGTLGRTSQASIQILGPVVP